MTQLARRRRRPLARLAVPAVAVLGTLAAAGTAQAGSDEPGEPEPTLLDAGDGETIELPVPYAVGQAAVIDSTFATEMKVAGVEIDFTLNLVLDSQVTELTAEGGALIESLIADVAATSADPSLDLSSIEDVAGLSYVETYSPEGVVLDTELLGLESLSPEQRSAAQELLASSQSVDLEFPKGAVGVGARWDADTMFESQGLSIPVTYHYELVALDAATYTVEISYDADVDTTIQGAHVSGTVSGRGTIVGDRENPLMSTVDVTQDLEMTMAGQGTITMRIEVDMVASERDGSAATTATAKAA